MKLSYAQRRELDSIDRYGYMSLPRSMSSAGGQTQTFAALCRKGLIEHDNEHGGWKLTEAGHQALDGS